MDNIHISNFQILSNYREKFLAQFFNFPFHFSVSTQYCDQVVLELTNAAENVVQLYRRLTEASPNSNENLTSVQKTDMVKNLEMSIAQTQKMLQDLTLEKVKHHFNVNQTDAVKKLKDLVSKGFTKDQNALVVVMQLYSDILLEMLQQNFQSNNI